MSYKSITTIIRENMPNSSKRAQVKGVLRPTDPGKEKFQIIDRPGDPIATDVRSGLSREAQIKLKIKEGETIEEKAPVKATENSQPTGDEKVKLGQKTPVDLTPTTRDTLPGKANSDTADGATVKPNKSKTVKEETKDKESEAGKRYEAEKAHWELKKKRAQKINKDIENKSKTVKEEEDTEEKSLARGNPPGWSKLSMAEKQAKIKAMKKRHGAQHTDVKISKTVKEGRERPHGQRVRIMGHQSMGEFYGKTGQIAGKEGQHYRVKLDDPVHIKGVGKVTSDLWEPHHLKTIKEDIDKLGRRKLTTFDRLQRKTRNYLQSRDDKIVKHHLQGHTPEHIASMMNVNPSIVGAVIGAEKGRASVKKEETVNEGPSREKPFDIVGYLNQKGPHKTGENFVPWNSEKKEGRFAHSKGKVKSESPYKGKKGYESQHKSWEHGWDQANSVKKEETLDEIAASTKADYAVDASKDFGKLAAKRFNVKSSLQDKADAIRKMGNRAKWIEKAKKVYTNKEEETLDEVSTDRLKGYISKAKEGTKPGGAGTTMHPMNKSRDRYNIRKLNNRTKGISLAAQKINDRRAETRGSMKEETLNETSTKKLATYIIKADISKKQSKSIDSYNNPIRHKREKGLEMASRKLLKKHDYGYHEETNLSEVEEWKAKTLSGSKGTVSHFVRTRAKGNFAASRDPHERKRLDDRMKELNKQWAKKPVKEETLDEISRLTLTPYLKAADSEIDRKRGIAFGSEKGDKPKARKDINKRNMGMARAWSRLQGKYMAKRKNGRPGAEFEYKKYGARAEETQLDEISKDKLYNYQLAASGDYRKSKKNARAAKSIEGQTKWMERRNKRYDGLKLAAAKQSTAKVKATEETQLDELYGKGSIGVVGKRESDASQNSPRGSKEKALHSLNRNRAARLHNMASGKSPVGKPDMKLNLQYSKEDSAKARKLRSEAHNRFKGGLSKSVYKCGSCGKNTRDTGNDEAGVGLCKKCLFDSYIENTKNDYGVNSIEHKAALKNYSLKEAMFFGKSEVPRQTKKQIEKEPRQAISRKEGMSARSDSVGKRDTSFHLKQAVQYNQRAIEHENAGRHSYAQLHRQFRDNSLIRYIKQGGDPNKIHFAKEEE